MKNNPTPKQFYIPAQQHGLTLVEVMVALVLSLVLIGSMIQIYLSSKQTYRMNEALSRLQEGGRIALDTLAYDIRHGSFQGCADTKLKDAIIMSQNIPTPITNLFMNGIGGTEGADDPSAVGAGVTYSDTLTLLYAAPSTATPVLNTSTISQLDIAANTAGFAAGDFLVVSNCSTADVFTATTVTATAITHNDAGENNPITTGSYSDGLSSVYRLVSNRYFVAKTTRNTASNTPISALFRTDINGTTTELVDGIEYMEVLYGERLENNNLRYVPANDGALDMSRVVSVRLGLLLVSDEAVLEADDTRDYQLVTGTTISNAASGAATYNGTDRRMRRVFTTTVQLRNR